MERAREKDKIGRSLDQEAPESLCQRLVVGERSKPEKHSGMGTEINRLNTLKDSKEKTIKKMRQSGYM